MQKQPLVLAALIAACAATAGCLDNPHPPRVDLVIRGGLVVDGTGTPPRLLDLAIADGRIVALDAPGIARPARRVIDAGGWIVAPGFIDMHSHADLIVQSPAERQQLAGR